MLLIISTLGAMSQYPDQAMMKKTFGAFLNSLDRQTKKDFRLFLACHDRPERVDYPWIEWCSMMVDPECEQTRFWGKHPETIIDDGITSIGSYGHKITDMSRKTFHAVVRAGHWAWQNQIKEFWMLRMDSDDLLAKDFVHMIPDLDRSGIEAVYNRRCHMYDPVTGEIGEHNYPYSTTCNAIKMKFDGQRLPRWYYHCMDHTRFMGDVRRDKISWREVDWTLCITTNSGNTISGRPNLRKHEHTRPIPLTDDLKDRYGLLDAFNK
ncbi:MAG: hypothetical protein MUP27_09375 [Desulfobacterales bacterium]|nr:hypothetical protein [Desulfobacterales bacterium]